MRDACATVLVRRQTRDGRRAGARRALMVARWRDVGRKRDALDLTGSDGPRVRDEGGHHDGDCYVIVDEERAHLRGGGGRG